jgi:hypothetical protein
MSSVTETYRRASEDELVALCAEIDSLTDEARYALRAEINTRGLSDEQVASQIETLKRDQEEQKQIQLEAKRKRPVRWLLILAQIVIVFAIGTLAALFSDYINLNPSQRGSTGEMMGYGVLLTLAASLTWFRGKIWTTVIVCFIVDGALLTVAFIFSR